MNVVTNTDDATAGSRPIRSSTVGTAAPAKPATTMLPHMARSTTGASRRLWPRKWAATRATSAANTPRAIPFTTPTTASFPTTSNFRSRGPLTRANRRTVTARAWVPEFPPIPATIGMIAARNQRLSITSLKRKTTEAATDAVTRLSIIQGRRLRTASFQSAASSSSSETPASRRMSSVCSASMTSITSSNVIRPRSWSNSLTTGMLTML